MNVEIYDKNDRKVASTMDVPRIRVWEALLVAGFRVVVS